VKANNSQFMANNSGEHFWSIQSTLFISTNSIQKFVPEKLVKLVIMKLQLFLPRMHP